MSYYHKTAPGREHPNSWYIQRQRAYERIMETQKPPTQKAVEKYGIKFDDKGRVIIPNDLAKPKIKIGIAPKVMKVQDSVEYLLNNYKIKGETPGPESVKKFKQLGSVLELVEGYTPDNIIPTLEKPEAILEAIQKKYTNMNTTTQKFQVVLTHVDNVPMGLPASLVGKYKQMFHDLKQKNTESKLEHNKEEPVYRWDKILAETDKLDPLGRFFFRMFDEVPIRMEFAKPIPVVHQESDKPQEGNFVMDKGGHSVQLVLRDWKTKGEKYPDEVVYKFSPKLCDLYRQRGVGHILLPGVKDWPAWVVQELNNAGFPDFAKFEKKDIASALRRTVATFRNSTYNTSGAPKGAELARLMLHDLATSKLVYQHTDFK